MSLKEIAEDVDRFDENQLKTIQFKVLSGLIQYGVVFLHKIKNIITDKCLINDRGKYFYNVIKEVLEYGLDVDDLQFENYTKYLKYHHYLEDREKTFGQLNKLRSHKVSQANALEYAKILARIHYRKQVIDGLNDLVGELKFLRDNTPTEEVESKVIGFIRNCEVGNSGEGKLELLGVGLEDYVESVLNGKESIPGIDLGFPLLEHHSGGITAGTVTVIAARPGTGKSALALNMALNAVRNNVPVLYIDLEMHKWQMWPRALANIGGININSIIFKTLKKDPAAVDLLKQTKDLALQLPITWVQSAGMDVKRQLSYAQRWLAQDIGYYNDKANPCLLIIDYMKSTAISTKNAKQHELLEEAAINIKDFASINGIPVILPVQLNREATKTPRGNAANISGSDGILKNVDTVWELSAKTDSEITHDNADAEFNFGNMVLIQTKARNAEKLGDGNYISLNFDGPTMKFTECGMKYDIIKKKKYNKPKAKSREEIDVPI